MNCGNLITKIGGGKRERKIKLWQLKCQNRRRGERKKLNCDNLIAEIGRERREKKLNCGNLIAEIVKERETQIDLKQSHC